MEKRGVLAVILSGGMLTGNAHRYFDPRGDAFRVSEIADRSSRSTLSQLLPAFAVVGLFTYG